MKYLNYLAIAVLAACSPLSALTYSDSYDCCEPECHFVDISGNVGFESRYVYRGSKLAKESILPELTFSLPLQALNTPFNIYAGAWAVFPVRNSENNGAQQINPYMGLDIDASQWCLSLDVGYLRYIYTNTDDSGKSFHNHNTNHQNELYFGARADLLLSPAFYAYYNFNLSQWTLEASANHSFDFLECYSDCLTLDVSAKLGWLHAKCFNGDQRAPGVIAHCNEYFYAHLIVNLSIHINEHASWYLGPRFSINNDGHISPLNPNGPYTANAIDDDQANLWWGAGLNFHF